MAYYSYYIYKLIIKLKAGTLCIAFFLILYAPNAYTQDQQQIQIATEYLIKGDKKKAVELFRDLAKSEINIPFVHNNYLNVLLDLGYYDEAQNYLKKKFEKRTGEHPVQN